ncbi:uncharacterized protein LOC141914171 [Tubulanus polymorphus]|uniref:uncharacterized protein LOC141914171 n=1 Tax=Tubulanus polymorphus TaxID=672921 RepID=UPI003DA3637D
MELIQFITVTAVLLVLVAQGNAVRPDKLICAICIYYDGDKAIYDDMRDFANELGMLDQDVIDWTTAKTPYNTKECMRNMWNDPKDQDDLERVEKEYQFFLNNITGIDCPVNHECMEIQYRNDAVIRGCMPELSGKCQSTVEINGRDFKVLCCDEINMCNSAATFRMNMMIYSAVSLFFCYFILFT